MDIMKRIRKINYRDKIWIILAAGITLLATIRFFYMLLGDYYTFVDEYQTFDTAVGFLKTGKLYQWDFHTQSLTGEAYSRAWPHTLLLVFWFHIFGISVPAGKALSGVLGILFILSVFYISYRIYYNYFITILSCMFLLGNDSVVIVFRQIRMYSLWLLLIIWFLFFVFLLLEESGKFSDRNRITSFFKNYINYSIKYVIFTLLFLVFSYITHINTLVTGAGIFLFFIYLLIVKHEKRHFGLLLLMLGAGAVVGILFLICAKGIHVPVIFELYLVLTSSSFLGQYDEQNIRYLYWVRDFLGNAKYMVVSCVFVLIALLKNIKNRDKKFDFSLYSIFIIGTSLYCFMYVFSRYYQDRYFIYVAPLLAVTLAWGIVEIASVGKSFILPLIVSAFFIISVFFHIKLDFTDVYFNEKICYHKLVYEEIQKDSKIFPIPIAGYNFRDYYGVQVIPDYITAPFDRSHDMEILYEFAKEHPQGYVAVETAKIYGITESMRIFMQNHSERIAGDGVDEWNIDVSRYHFLYPQKGHLEMFEGTGWESGCVTYSFGRIEESTEIRISVDTSQMAENAKILFLSFGIFTEKQESLPLCFQLVLPENAAKGEYQYSVVVNKPCLAVELRDDCEVYYWDESYKELKLWEK